MSKTAYEKMNIKMKERVIFLNTPSKVISLITFDGIDQKETLRGKFDYIIVCFITETSLNKQFPTLKKHIEANGKLWIAWPKAKKLNTHLSIRKVIKIGYDYGMVESTNLSINSVWTTLKFTWPKAGKKYNNSYGTLPLHSRS